MIATPARGSAWRAVDVVLLVLSTTFGVAMWAAATVGVHYAATARQAVTWLDVAAVGLTGLGAGNCLWLLRGRRAIGRRRLALVTLALPDGDPALRAVGIDKTERSKLVRIPGGVLAHQLECPLVAGKEVKPAGRAAASLCRVCST